MLNMITFRPFWDFLKDKNISTYMLIYTYGINSYTIDRLRHDKPLKTSTRQCYKVLQGRNLKVLYSAHRPTIILARNCAYAKE